MMNVKKNANERATTPDRSTPHLLYITVFLRFIIWTSQNISGSKGGGTFSLDPL
jgi:hypothetical protein